MASITKKRGAYLPTHNVVPTSIRDGGTDSYVGRGLIDEMEQPAQETIHEIRTGDPAVARWLSKFDS